MPIIPDDFDKKRDTFEEGDIEPTDVFKTKIAGLLQEYLPGKERNKLVLEAWAELDAVSPAPYDQFPNPLKPEEMIKKPLGINILDVDDLRD